MKRSCRYVLLAVWIHSCIAVSTCLAAASFLTDTRAAVLHVVHSKMHHQYQDTLTSSDQPKGALFQKEAAASQRAVSSGWFMFGLYVLIALVFSGLSGYTAIAKGLNPIPYFFFGFFLSGLGYLYVLTRRSNTRPGEVPEGLVKVPTTLTPVPCPKCGNTNHPAARKCLSCGAALRPSAQSEVGKVK